MIRSRHPILPFTPQTPFYSVLEILERTKEFKFFDEQTQPSVRTLNQQNLLNFVRRAYRAMQRLNLQDDYAFALGHFIQGFLRGYGIEYQAPCLRTLFHNQTDLPLEFRTALEKSLAPY